MFLKAARTITILVVLLMSLEILGAAVTVCSPESDATLTVHQKKSKSSVIASLLFEKAEEETEKTEEEKDCMLRIIIADFSAIAISLSLYHTPQTHFAPLAFQYNVRPPLHRLNCVFLI